jgi:serine/threonine-protein kinase
VFPGPEHHHALRDFQIQRRLGSGGAGQVFLALSKAGRPVAIKVLSDAKERDRAFSEELVREASLCVRLTHPAIVQVRALIEEEGFAAIVFDYVEGVPLSRVLKLCGALGVRLPDKVAWHIAERVLSALAYAHKQTDESHAPAPIVHRDVSPSNVLVAWTGDVKLTDFGIAKMLGVSPTTQYGLVKGTLGCMAPEQARGEPVDARADVYAAALLAWRLSTGRNPYASHDKDELELVRAMKNPRVKPLSALRPNLPEPILEAVAIALEPAPKDRTIGAEQLARVVRAHMDVEAGRADLERLLGPWRPALEKRQDKRRPQTAPGDAPPSSRRTPSSALYDSSSSGDQKLPTMRYEDVAGGEEEDEAVSDGPTLQLQALPESWIGPSAPSLRESLAQVPLELPPVVPSESEFPPAHTTAPLAAPGPQPGLPAHPQPAELGGPESFPELRPGWRVWGWVAAGIVLVAIVAWSLAGKP